MFNRKNIPGKKNTGNKADRRRRRQRWEFYSTPDTPENVFRSQQGDDKENITVLSAFRSIIQGVRGSVSMTDGQNVFVLSKKQKTAQIQKVSAQSWYKQTVAAP